MADRAVGGLYTHARQSSGQKRFTGPLCLKTVVSQNDPHKKPEDEVDHSPQSMIERLELPEQAPHHLTPYVIL